MSMPSMPHRYHESQLSHASFGYVVARIVCAECGNRELAHGRKFQTGARYLLLPEPEGGRTRGMFVARKLRMGTVIPKLFVAYPLNEVPTDVPTHLRCRKHGVRLADGQDIIDGILSGDPKRPVVIPA